MVKRKIAIDVDPRTGTLTENALLCRALGHKWERKSSSRMQTIKLLNEGLYEVDRYCGNGCGCTWRQVWSIKERIVVETERVYPPKGDYLLPAGSGRLRRGDAMAANVVRELAGVL